ncbi:MAG: dienelactone hydrolase family protein [Acidobacteria bacterium]|nr:dienelactone hydrolase family protein [Acidobacteriota bacterium]
MTMRAWVALCGAMLGLRGQSLPGTEPLTLTGDPAKAMVEGMGRWLERDGPRLARRRPGDVERLRTILGAVDQRVAFGEREVVGNLARPAERAAGVRAVRWPVFEGVHGEGLLFEPVGESRGGVVALPDADGAPERFAVARQLAAAGFTVVAPVLIDRADTWSGNAAIGRMTNQPHREFLYRMAFPMGRHIIGYEVQKVLAAVDWLARRNPGRPVGLWGYGEGGLIALYAGALEPRVAVTEVSGYFGPRAGLAEEPIYRNVWTLLRDFGDAEVAALYGGRRLLIDPAPGPSVDGPPAERAGRRGAAPGRLRPVPAAAVRAEVERARAMGASVELVGGAGEFIRAMGGTPGREVSGAIALVEADERMQRQFLELVRFTERLVRGSQRLRDADWAKAGKPALGTWREQSASYRERVWDDVIGRLPAPAAAPGPRTRLSYRGQHWDGYEVTLDLFPEVFAYGVLLVPKGIRPGERLPVVVAQHGLQGRPQDLFLQPEVERNGTAYSGFHYYQNIAERLADRGFVVYVPQNPYTGEFRQLVRQANPWGWSLYSFILAQNERVLDWLGRLAFVDERRIGFYGLSYGGKVAVRIPPLLERYAVSICSGDFNEWVYKLAAYEEPFSYIFSGEYEMPEWNLGQVASHAEMVYLMAPRPFMVERGHDDGVGTDEWVAHEYARVQRFYDKLGIGDRTRIEYFDGPHQIHGVGTVEFLIRFLEPSRR